jgi:hypothetical protein
MPPLPQLQHPVDRHSHQIEHGPSATPQAARKVGACNRDGQERIEYTKVCDDVMSRAGDAMLRLARVAAPSRALTRASPAPHPRLTRDERFGVVSKGNISLRLFAQSKRAVRRSTLARAFNARATACP